MFENQTAPAKSGKTIWGLRRLFFTGIMQHVWSCPPISGDHQYVSAQVRPVEAFHIGCCSLTEQPVELRLFQISLFFLYRCNELTTPWLWICQRQVWQLIVRVEIMKWFFQAARKREQTRLVYDGDGRIHWQGADHHGQRLRFLQVVIDHWSSLQYF